MLQSKFAKKNLNFKAQKLFTDRMQPRDVFSQSIAAFDEKPREIINFYGKGGVGKTTLMRNLIKESVDTYAPYKKTEIRNIFISLDAFEYANPVNILTAIRAGIRGDCSLFDYAMTQYYAKARMTIDEIKKKNKFLSDSMVGMLNDAVSIATQSACIPVSLISKVFSLIKDARIKSKYRDEIAEMATLSEFDLFERLPYYLGICVNLALSKNVQHVLFLDSYESLLNRTVRGTPSVQQEEWLQEFFLSCDKIRIVVASRDRMRWDKQDAEWAEFFNPHRLNDLSEEDSRWFLEHVPIEEEEVIDAIVSRTEGVPLYLDMCVDIYESCKNDGKPFDPEFVQNGEAIIDRYMRHLSPHDRYAVKVISVPRCFELPFAVELLKRQNLVYTADELVELLEKSVFLPITEDAKIYKVDESIRHHLMSIMDDEQKCGVFRDILDYMAAEKGAVVYAYFGSALDSLIENPYCFDKLFDSVFALTEFYANAGYWRELNEILGKHIDAENPRLRALAVTVRIIYERRSGSMRTALEFIEKHPVDLAAIGHWAFLYRYLCIQVRHLLGYYDECIVAYKALLGEMNLVRHDLPAHIYNIVALKYADLLFLKGDFTQSLRQTEELLSLPDLPIDDRLELIRLKGHNYRFRRMSKEAETIYLSALHLTEEHGMINHRGKLYTNLTEALCTANPVQAIEWYKKSVEENGRLDNYIELGKTYAAGAAAYTAAGDAEQGIALGKKALETAQKTQYHSGQAFALAALCFAYKCAGRKEESEQTLKELKALLKQLNVYLYIADWFHA